MINIYGDTVPLYNIEFDNEHNINCPNLENYIIDDGKVHACIIICPGGGYDHRSNKEGANIAKKLNEAGVSAVVLNYRVYPYVYPVGLNDAKRAIRFLRYNCEKFNIDSNKIGIMGFSAGGHLAVSVAEFYDKFDYKVADDIDKISARPDLVGLCYPVINFDKEYSHMRSVGNLFGEQVRKTELVEIMCCDKSVRDDMPSTFVWHTFEDVKVDCRNSIDLVLAMKEKGIDIECHLFQDGGHGLNLAEDIEGTKQWFCLFVNWLKRKKFCI